MKKALVLAISVLLAHGGFVIAQTLAVPPGDIPSWLPRPGVRTVPLEHQVLPTEVKAQAREALRSLRERGYVETTDEAVVHLGRHEGLESVSAATQKLGHPPSVVGPTLGRARVVGAVAHGARGPQGWNMFTRVFRLNDVLIELEEMDLTTSGAILTQEFLNASVNGWPAVLMVRKSPHQTMTTLTWFTDRNGYTLRAIGDVRTVLLGIADEIGR